MSGEIIILETSDREEGSSGSSVFPTGFVHGLKKIFTLAWALILVQFSQVVIHPMTLLFAGHLGKLELDAVALSLTLTNITGYSVVWGMSTACDTLFSQAFGSKNKKLIGVQLQRALLIHLLALMVCLAIQLNIEAILRVLGQDHDVARLCGKYMTVFIPGMFFMFTYIILRKYILNQGIIMPLLVISIFGLGVHILLQYLFLYQARLGVEGSALGQAGGYFVLSGCTIGYIFISGMYRDTWAGWDRRMLQGWGEFAKLALSGLLMACLEWWALEITVILTGTLGTTELGAQSLMFSFNLLVAGIPSGIGVAISITVGVALGARHPLEAKTISRIGFTIGGLLMTIPVIFMMIFRKEIPALFTNDKDIIELAALLMPPATVYVFMNGICSIARGTMRGCGKQAVATVIVFFGFFLLALPVGIPLLLLTELHMLGLWIALACALTLDAIGYLLYFTVRLDWKKASEEACVRSRVKMVKQEETGENISNDLSERTPLLRNNTKSQETITFNNQGGITTSREDTAQVLSSSLIYKRIGTICLFVTVLVAGVLGRLFITVSDIGSYSGDTISSNVTYAYLYNSTTVTTLVST